MRLLKIILLIIFLSSNSFAQNTQILEDQPANPVANIEISNTQIEKETAPLPTITIETKIVQIILNDEHRQGVDWEAIVTDFHSLAFKKENDPAWTDQKNKLSVGQVSNEDFDVLLDALDTVGRVTHADLPETVLNRDQVKTIDFPVDGKFLPNISMDLIWFNSASGELKLGIDSSIGLNPKDNIQEKAVQILKCQTDVNLIDQNTIILGGLMHEEEIKKMRKFPLLGSLPFVGLVFRKQGKLMQRTETIVFLTIHTNAVQLPAEEKN